MSKQPLNIFRTDIEDIAESIKLKLMAHDEAAQIGVDSAGDVSIAWPDAADVPADWLIGTYTRKARVDDIEFDLVERLRELKAQQAKRRVVSVPATPKPAPKRTAAQQPSVLRRISESALGCIPAPALRPRSAAPAVRPKGPETVAEFRARGGKVEHVQGFEAVRPSIARPAWKAAA
ncbi:hypothetical protein [Luteimonas fraxinea]|uniref:Uncharacterized protein n=1 Tax=Luteimonas fraxinea TaxID=2901869 RepID=A0ABS8U9K1_9GAMM|nr:hypothetical protein [Luteimonas fraxinea]MCD9096171.1 hypothetical protein [Luteimonas fraxinea]